MSALHAEGHFEPSLAATFLPRCPNCGNRHPLAHQPPAPIDRCPSCGASVPPPGRPVVVPAVLTGRDPASIVTRACFGLARFFRRLAGGSPR